MEHTSWSASNPTEFAAPVPTLLSPAEKLGTDFAHGWAKIPDETRLNIMGYVMSSTSNIRWIRAVPLSSRARPGDFTMGRNLREYLGMGGELAHLALEAFYKYNTISIDVEECEERWTTVLVLPPWYVRQHIRSIVLKVICTHKGWEFLARVAQGKYGLRLVKHVVVELDTTTLTRHFLEQPPVGITFACSGDLIMHGFDTADTRWFLARAKMTEEKFISRMNSTVRFSG